MNRTVRSRLVPTRAALAALAGVAMLGAGIGGAGAIPGGAVLAATSQPTLGVGQVNQLAGNLTITPNVPANTFAASEQIVIRVDDADVAPNCSPTPPASVSSDYVAFASVPTVTVSGTATLQATTIRPQPAGLCVAAGRSDELVITFATAGTATLTISNIRYDVGALAAPGPVKLTAESSAGPGNVTLAIAPANSNATLTTVKLSANNPTVGLRQGSGIQGISNLVISEQVADALATGSTTQTVCVQLDTPTDTFDTTAPVPTITTTPGGGDTATVTSAQAGRSLEVNITDINNTDTAASTFTISGVRLSPTTTSTTGPVTASLLVGPCATAILAFAQNIVVAGVVDVERFGGSDRYTTAQILFEDAFPCVGNGLGNVIIARGDLFPDALSASYLAGKNNTGILLVDSANPALPVATVNALRNRGADSVTIVGGVTAVPAALATALDNLPNVTCAGTTQAAPNDTISVNRIGGLDRYETARFVAENPGLNAAGTADYDGTPADPDGPACAPRRTAILATGENFPDALVAGVAAYGGVATFVNPCGSGGFPLLLTNSTSLHPQAAAALNNLGIQQVLIMGGTSAVSTAVETAVQGINSIQTRRFAGLNRLDTAKQFAEFAIDFLGYDDNHVSVARGDAFPDALAGAPHAIQNPDVGYAPIVLTDSPTSAGTETLNFFRERQGVAGVLGAPNPLVVMEAIDIYGGVAAVADSTVAAILAAISEA